MSLKNIFSHYITLTNFIIYTIFMTYCILGMTKSHGWDFVLALTMWENISLDLWGCVLMCCCLYVSQPLEISMGLQCNFLPMVLPSILMCDIQVHKDLRETTLFTPESPAAAITFTLSDPHRNGQILRDGLFSLFPQHSSSLCSSEQ